MARKKKVKENITIHGIADKGMAVGKDEDGIVYFVDGPVPGDKVDVLVLRKKSSYRKGIVQEYKSLSSERVEPFCSHFYQCGGCKWQHLDYKAQLKYKASTVFDAFDRIAGIKSFEKLPILACDKTTLYRNKLEYSFSSRRWVPKEELDRGEEVIFGPAAGFHKAGAFDKIVQIETCYLQEDFSNQLRNRIDQIARKQEWTYYNSREHHGFLRNLVIRNTTLEEWMMVMVFGENKKEEIEFLLSSIQAEFPKLTSIYYTVNKKMNDTINDLTLNLYHGNESITEALGNIKYKIGPKSFFQTNSNQAKILYEKIVEMADLKPTDVVYDLYTGLGSIALFISNACKYVVGIEEIPEAIQDARSNKAFNKIDNVHFEVGDVKDLFDNDFIKRHGQADLIIVDPPRAGLHKDVCHMLNQAAVQKIIYVSCNPSTQARDILILSEEYNLIKIQPVDMFPHTHHIENIAVLRKK